MAAFEVWKVEIFRKINLDETFGIHDKIFPTLLPDNGYFWSLKSRGFPEN